MKKSKIYNFSDDEFIKIINESYSYRECCKNQDYRLENLRLLCPNCHSQIETFGSRQRRAKTIL